MTANELIEQSLLIAEQNKKMAEQKFLHFSADQLNRKPIPSSGVQPSVFSICFL